MNRMAIAHRVKHFQQQLSGGQQQRVAIDRAVVANPKLILADEPTGNLDSKNGKEVMELLTELNKEGTTIVWLPTPNTIPAMQGEPLICFGFATTARAIATRCCCPPDSCCGKCFTRWAIAIREALTN